MIATVQLFARARDLAGAAVVAVELPEGATVADLRRALGKTCPALTVILDHCAVAVDNDWAAEDRLLAPGSAIALLPPVSGG